MTSWKDDKDLGPWAFHPQPDKWGYLNNPRWYKDTVAPVNYTGNEDEEPQVWTSANAGKGPYSRDGFDRHHPCGHWHKQPLEESAGPVSEFEVYFELLPGTVSQPSLGIYTDLLSSESFISVNANDFDGTVSWYFEVVGFNSNDFDVTVYAIDSDDNIYSTVVIPSGTVGVTGYELFRIREDFTPTIYDNEGMYGIKVEIPEGETLSYYPLTCMITVARIIVRQSEATKSYMQIPLYGYYYNYALQEYSSYPYDYPVGMEIYDLHTVSDTSTDGYMATSVWQYNSGELSNISKISFSPAVRGPTSRYKSTYINISATSNFQHFHYMLYSTTGSDIQRDDATPDLWTSDTQVHTDNVSGRVYTPVPNSLVYWQSGVDAYPFTYDLTPDMSGFGPGTHYFAVGGELYYGLPLENEWEHWQTWLHFTIPTGYKIDTFSIHVASYSPKDMRWTIEYTLVPNDATITISLYDITAGALVVGSELEWDLDEVFSRKFAELTSSSLISGHEYRAAIDLPYDVNTTWIMPPEIMDAQLLIGIDPISHITTWRRCLMHFIGEHDNWTVPDAWGVDYWGSAQGSICVSPRVLMYVGESDSVYFETTIYSQRTLAVGQEDYFCVYLEDLTVDENSGATGSDVVESLLQWPEDIENVPSRKRSASLTVVNDNVYGNRQPNGPDDYYAVFINGFIVTKII